MPTARTRNNTVVTCFATSNIRSATAITSSSHFAFLLNARSREGFVQANQYDWTSDDNGCTSRIERSRPGLTKFGTV